MPSPKNFSSFLALAFTRCILREVWILPTPNGWVLPRKMAAWVTEDVAAVFDNHTPPRRHNCREETRHGKKTKCGCLVVSQDWSAQHHKEVGHVVISRDLSATMLETQCVGS